MTSRRRAALVLSGGFVVAGALVAPATLAAAEPTVPALPSVSVACVDRTIALLSAADAGLGLASVVPLVPAPMQVPAPSTNPAVAVVTVSNPGDGSFDVLVGRDADVPVQVVAPAGATVSSAFDVADAGTSVFRVTDPAGTELALVASTSDCSTPEGWCEADREPGAPVAADHADICPVPGDEVFTVPEAAEEPAPTGKVVDGEPEVLAAGLAQTLPPPPVVPPSAIVVPSAAPPPTVASAPIIEVAAPLALPVDAGPQLALSGSRTSLLGQLAALLLGIGAAVTGVGRRRVDVELDDRASDAMARIFAASRSAE